MSALRVVVVGADAAGMSAAHQALRAARRTGMEIAVTALETTGDTSYSACGIPYWIAGDVASGDDLVARTPDEHRAAGVDLRLHTTATAVDLAARTVTAQGPDGAETLHYDDLVLTTGAAPVVPAWARAGDGTLVDGVGAVKTLSDGAAWRSVLEAEPHAPVVVVGGGYIGVEAAEALLARGRRVTLVTRRTVLSGLGSLLSERVSDAMARAGVDVRLETVVTGLEVRDGRVVGVRTSGGVVEAGLVVLAVGITPRTDLVAGQVELGDRGALRPDPHGRIADGLWAAGDCCEVRHRVSDRWAYLPLGTHANKHGRTLGDHVGSGGASPLSFDGALGTAITRFRAGDQSLEMAMTGLTEPAALAAGLDAVALLTEGTTASGYMPEASPIALTVVAERGTRRLLGVQVVGGPGAGKRVDAAAACLWHAGTVDDLAWMDLSYAPPFATAWEILQVAARRLAERL